MENSPLLLVIEDLHWADPTTLELLNLLVDQIATTPIFALFTFRPNFNPPWSSRAYLTNLLVHRLTRKKSIDIIQHIAGPKLLTSEVLEQILTKTDGVPLFVEELTLAEQLLGLAHTTNDHAFLSDAYRAIGETFLWSG